MMKRMILVLIVLLAAISIGAMKIQGELFSPVLNVKSTVAVVNGEYLDVDFSGEGLNILIPKTRESLMEAVALAIEKAGFETIFISNIMLYVDEVDNVVILPGKASCTVEELRNCLLCCLTE